MGNEGLANKWHTFEDRPDNVEFDDTVYEVIELYERYNSHTAKWDFECYPGLCFWNWEEHKFMDVFASEYFDDGGRTPGIRDYKLFWRVADLPPGMKNYPDRMYTELCRQHIRPFYDERELIDFEEAREWYEDLHCDDKWKELHGE